MKDISVNREPTELRQMLDYLGIAAFVIDVVSADEFRLAAINSRHEQLTGMKHSEVAGHSIDELFSPDMAAGVIEEYRRCVETKAVIDYQEKLDFPIGRTFWQTVLVPFFDESGNVTRLLGTANEISAQMHMELEAHYQATVMSAYLDESPDGILVVDANNKIKTWNRRFLELWSISEEIMNAGDGNAALEAVVEQVQAPSTFVERVKELNALPEEEEREVRIDMKDGRVLQRYSRGLYGSAGDYWGRIWFYRDVTKLQHMTDKLLHMSQTDSLTGIANRRVLFEALKKEYSRAQRYDRPLSVLMLDLDHFKRVNDRYGHPTGDAVLREFVQVVKSEIRDSDYFARMGGEEFAIVLPECRLEAARQKAERLCRAVAAHTIDTLAGPLSITVSIGAATISDKDVNPDHLLSRADQCLYAAKSEGRNRVFPRGDVENCV